MMRHTTTLLSPVQTVPSPEVRADLELAQRAASGDREAQRRLLEQVVPVVRSVSRALAGTQGHAEDATQNALLEVLQNAGNYRGRSPLGPWARTIAARTTRRYVAKERRKSTAAVRRHGADDIHDPTATRSCDAPPGDVGAYLRTLPHAQRQAIVMHHALGYTLGEIAARERRSPNTIKSRLRLGMLALRRLAVHA